MSIVEEEADESLYWLELLAESNVFTENKLTVLMHDIDEGVAMTVSSIKTLRTKITEQSKIQNLKSKI